MCVSIPRLQLGLLLLLSVALIVAACGGGDDDEPSAEQSQAGVIEPDTEDPDIIEDAETEQSDDGESVSVQNPNAPGGADQADAPAAPAPAAGDDDAGATAGGTTRNGIEIISLEGAGQGDPAQDGDSVGVRYRGTLDDGSEFDSNHDGELLPVTVGAGGVIVGFDEALRGLRLGETITVRIPAELAYGVPDQDLIFEFPREQTPPGMIVGQNVQLGSGQVATIVEITDEIVRIDANHELAGEALTFEITIEEFR